VNPILAGTGFLAAASTPTSQIIVIVKTILVFVILLVGGLF
jgi:hypothetical protein